MRNAAWWFAMTVTTVDAMVFVAAMPIFFKAGRELPASRLTLFASIATGLATTLATLGMRVTVEHWPMLIGGALGTGAQALFWGAIRAHAGHRPSGAFAADAPTGIVRRGPYRWVRHPFYTAYVMAFVAGAVFAQFLWLWVVPAWMVAIYVLAARQEERLILCSPLAPAYTAYEREAGAFVPRWRRHSMA